MERSIVQVTSKLYQPEEAEKERIEVEVFREEQEQFKIRTMKRPLVDVKPIPIIPTSNTLDILLVIKDVVVQDYDIISIGRVIEIARDYIKSMILHSNSLWEMSKFANLYQRAEPNVGLSSKEKLDLVEQIDKWINLISNIQSS